jgi:D-galactarolactone cycloisomerase
MKITQVEAIVIAIPYEHGAPKPVMGTGQPRTTMDAVYVRVDTDQGVTGWGEAFGFAACRATAVVVETVVAPLAVGRDPTDIDALMSDLHRRCQSLGRNGPGAFALAGLDIALWDIAGKMAGKSICQMLGGGSKKSVPAYASVLKTGGEIEYVRKLARRAVERGFGAIKLHERSPKAVAAARELLGPHFAIMMDVNCAWTLEEATQACREFEPLALDWLEEPIYPADDFAAMAELRQRTSVPIGAGENFATLKEAGACLEAKAVAILQPDVIRMAGITGAWKALQLAHKHGARGDPHSPYYGPGLIASLHLAAALPEEISCEHFFADLEASPLGDMIFPRKGRFAVPDGPGLGIEVDERILKRFRVA